MGSPVGPLVSATDSDEDVLFYELLDTPDLEDSDGKATLHHRQPLGPDKRWARCWEPTHEEREDVELELEDLIGDPPLPTYGNARSPQATTYMLSPGNLTTTFTCLRVRVSDPSTASDTVNVVVRVTDVNEPPEFDKYAPTLLIVSEVVEEDAPTPDIIVWYSGEAVGSQMAPTPSPTRMLRMLRRTIHPSYTYSLSGADRSYFTFDENGKLSLDDNHKPDREEKRYYLITIEARSGQAARGLLTTLDVIVVVLDAEDPGEVTLSQREPQVGREVHARVSDPDGGVRDIRWVWQRSNEITVNDEGTTFGRVPG